MKFCFGNVKKIKVKMLICIYIKKKSSATSFDTVIEHQTPTTVTKTHANATVPTIQTQQCISRALL